jgi:hypothetical protein
MKPYDYARVVKKWCGMRTNPVLRCFDNSEGLNCEDLTIGVVPELANGMRLGTVVPSQDLSGACITVRG